MAEQSQLQIEFVRSKKVERVYHHFEKWEDQKFGFYDNCNPNEKDQLLSKVVDIFSCQKTTEAYMKKVVQEWIYSCEHNLSNYSMNRVAYLGQAACCLYASIPCTVTMEGWSLVSKKNRDAADKIAERIINDWELCRR